MLTLRCLWLVGLAAGAETVSRMLLRNLGKENLGLYYLGAVNGNLDGSEAFCSSIAPDEVTGRYVHLNDSFAVRSGDLRWRSRITLFANDDLDRPFKISFHNTMIDDDPQPIELKHHDEGFIWIEPSHYLTHGTADGREFVVNDKDHASRFSVRIYVVDEGEL